MVSGESWSYMDYALSTDRIPTAEEIRQQHEGLAGSYWEAREKVTDAERMQPEGWLANHKPGAQKLRTQLEQAQKRLAATEINLVFHSGWAHNFHDNFEEEALVYQAEVERHYESLYLSTRARVCEVLGTGRSDKHTRGFGKFLNLFEDLKEPDEDFTKSAIRVEALVDLLNPEEPTAVKVGDGYTAALNRVPRTDIKGEIDAAIQKAETQEWGYVLRVTNSYGGLVKDLQDVNFIAVPEDVADLFLEAKELDPEHLEESATLYDSNKIALLPKRIGYIWTQYDIITLNQARDIRANQAFKADISHYPARNMPPQPIEISLAAATKNELRRKVISYMVAHIFNDGQLTVNGERVDPRDFLLNDPEQAE